MPEYPHLPYLAGWTPSFDERGELRAWVKPNDTARDMVISKTEDGKKWQANLAGMSWVTSPQLKDVVDSVNAYYAGLHALKQGEEVNGG